MVVGRGDPGDLDVNQRAFKVGGKPFSFNALIDLLPALPASQQVIGARLEALEDPHQRLSELDLEMAEKLHPNDRVRIIRALEVIEISGEKMSTLQKAPPRRSPLQALTFWLDRDGLRERIDARLKQMVAAGYRDETAALLEEGLSPSLKPMRAFAYRHMIEHLQGAFDLHEAIRRTARDTWRLARKQRNWAKSLQWLTGSGEELHRLVEGRLGDSAGM